MAIAPLDAVWSPARRARATRSAMVRGVAGSTPCCPVSERRISWPRGVWASGASATERSERDGTDGAMLSGAMLSGATPPAPAIAGAAGAAGAAVAPGAAVEEERVSRMGSGRPPGEAVSAERRISSR